MGSSWLIEAERRIERFRKAPLTVVVVDRAGRPVPGALVSVKLTKHFFGFGTAVNRKVLFRVDADGERYREAITGLFNKAVIENGLKWPVWEVPSEREVTLRAIKWLKDAGLEVRGHNVIWPSWRHLPGRLKAFAGDPKRLREEIRRRIEDVMGATRGMVTEWDVVNEPVQNRDLMDILGDEEMVEWFKRAHQIDPDCQLYINQNGVESVRSKYFGPFERMVGMLLSCGAPLGGIGVQGHMGEERIGPEELWEALDRLARFGVSLQITEFDATIPDPRRYGEYFRDFLLAPFAHPAVEGFLMWGFWDGAHWLNSAPLFFRDWRPKPGLDEYKRLVLEEWQTKAHGRTDEKGRLTVKGFLGEYEVTVEHRGKRVVRNFLLPKKGGEMRISIR